MFEQLKDLLLFGVKKGNKKKATKDLNEQGFNVIFKKKSKVLNIEEGIGFKYEDDETIN